jgi:hypothetical protein
MGAEWIVASEAAGCRRKTSSRRDRDQRSILDSTVPELPQEIIVDRISDRAALETCSLVCGQSSARTGNPLFRRGPATLVHLRSIGTGRAILARTRPVPQPSISVPQYPQ